MVIIPLKKTLFDGLYMYDDIMKYGNIEYKIIEPLHT